MPAGSPGYAIIGYVLGSSSEFAAFPWATLGNAGDVRPVGHGVSEMRIDYGPGYRVYFISRGPLVVILLAGGDKRTQSDDIDAAIQLARNL
jgi:putative addiction module killer protein